MGTDDKLLTPFRFVRFQEGLIKEIKKLERKRHAIPKAYKEQRAELSFFLTVLKTLGDTLAWHLFTSYWIRQQCKHLQHGTGRELIHNSDFDTEIYAARVMATDHQFVILNEITNCLNIGDLSVWGEGGVPTTVEVKYVHDEMTEKQQERLTKQIERMESLYNLQGEKAKIEQPQLNKTFKGYGEDTVLLRGRPLPKFRQNNKTSYGEELNALLWQVRKDGKERFVSFDGITGYKLMKVNEENVEELLSRDPKDLDPAIKDFMSDGGAITSIDIFSRGTEYPEIYPLTLLFDSQIAADLIFGDLILMTLINANKMALFLKSKDIEVDTSPENHYWKTKVYKIDNVSHFLDYPFKHVIFAVHSTEYLANYCLDSHEQSEIEKQKLLSENPEAKLIEFDYKLDGDGNLTMKEREIIAPLFSRKSCFPF